MWSLPVSPALMPRSSSGYFRTMCSQKASCHFVSFFLFPMISFADSLPSSVSGTNERCMCGVFSSRCTTAERIVPGSCFSLMKRSAVSKNSRISGIFLFSKNSGLAVTIVSTTRMLSVRVRHPASRICRSASVLYFPFGSTRWKFKSDRDRSMSGLLE